MEILIAIFGIVLGGGIAWFLAKANSQSKAQEIISALAIEREKNKSHEATTYELKRDIESERNKVWKPITILHPQRQITETSRKTAGSRKGIRESE